MLNLIVCYNKKRGIGKDGGIPWYSSEDLKRFKEITMGHTVVMGRKTWDSISAKFPDGLPGRHNIVLSKKKDSLVTTDRVNVINNIEILNEYIRGHRDCTQVFIIGGSTLYEYYLDKCDKLYISEINNTEDCDVFFPLISQKFKLGEVNLSKGINYYTYTSRDRLEHLPEKQYLEILQRIMIFGQETEDRTGVGTKSLFGERMRFDISQTIPVLTTKRVAWKTVIKELLWMLKGHTDNKLLQEQGVHIWDGNSSKDFLESLGLPYEEGDIGSNYGFQWRHWGEEYKGCKEDYTNKGIDQIKKLITDLKTNPHSRRHILSAWNVSELSNMTLNPCHCFAQFYVNKRLNTLSCQLYQRSGDMFLGVPFNIMSYSVLTYVLAKLTGYFPGELIHIIGDAHIYSNHEDQVKEQLQRQPLAFPKLILKDITDIDSITIEDFDLVGYTSHGAIKAKMAV